MHIHSLSNQTLTRARSRLHTLVEFCVAHPRRVRAAAAELLGVALMLAVFLTAAIIA